MCRCAIRRCSKKLDEVAKHWLDGGPKDDGFLSDVAAAGGNPEEFKTPEQDYEVHPDTWQALEAFDAAQTQWVLNHKGKRYGLNYLAAEMAWGRLGLTVSADDFKKIQALEKWCREAV